MPADQKKTREEAVKEHAPEEKYRTSKVFKTLSKKQLVLLADACLKFSELLAGVKLYPYEREFGWRVCYSVLSADGEEVTGLFSRQSGKTETVSVVVNGLLVMLPILATYIADKRIQRFRMGFWVGVFSPSHEQSDTMYSRMVKRLHSTYAHKVLRDRDILIDFDDEKHYANVNLPSGSFVNKHSAHKNAKIEGKTYHLIVCEEAQDIDVSVYKKSISPMGASTNASQLKIGTCNTKRSDYYDACQRNVLKAAGLKDKRLRLHYQFDYEVASKYNEWYGKYILKEIGRLGFESDEFKMAYRLIWLLERGMFVEPTLFGMMGGDYGVVTYDPVNEVVASIDVAKTRASTVVTMTQPDYAKGAWVGEGDFRCYKRILNWLELRGDNYTDQAKLIHDFLANYHGLRRIIIDATGVGEALLDMLKVEFAEPIAKGRIELVPFYADQAANHDGYLRLLGDLQNLRITYPNSARAQKYGKQQKFCQQMLSVQKEYNGAYINVGFGENDDGKMQKDFVSSLMLASLIADRVYSMPEVEQEINPLFRSGGAGLGASRGIAAARSRALGRAGSLTGSIFGRGA